ncbi:MAG: hypothetical protein M0P72_10700 [Metallibacterium scheffleri]|jgi:hypothetical protein|uniref:hypothetical protein n=1 Tax=Metallibacterium scheffleri TaxID=993689 RepID=UPI0026EDAA6A|nr:hypothetical protein [Metallibacterium scheffleri]MCK9367601.1 hypothetical protein [Metallibacterium scheffleri]
MEILYCTRRRDRVRVKHHEVAGAKQQPMHAENATVFAKARLYDRRTTLAGATDCG